MNVLIFSPLALEFGRGGEFFTVELAIGLKKFYNVEIIDTNRHIKKKILSVQDLKIKLRDVKRIDRINFAEAYIGSRVFSIPYPCEIIKLYKQIKHYGIVYSQLSTVTINFMFIVFSLLIRKTQFIIGYHKPLHSDKVLSLYNIKNQISFFLFSIFKKRILHHTISQYTKKFLEHFYPKNKVVYICEGVNLEKYDKLVEFDRTNTLRFIYSGYLDDVHKGVDILLKAVEQFIKEEKKSDVFFDFFGFGPLEILIKKLEEKYPNFIKYHGFVSQDELFKSYKECDVYLFSSRQEPFGRVIIEALAAEMVILCSKTIGSIEILKGKPFAFFIPELTPFALKEKLVLIYNLWRDNRPYFRELQKSARDYITQKYSINKEIDTFKELINKIIKREFCKTIL